MNIKNYIETQYRELNEYLTIEYNDLYNWESNKKLQEIFSTIHYLITKNYKKMNSRLPTKEFAAHFWAEDSRELIFAIDIILGLYRGLAGSKFAFNIDDYYFEIISKSQNFLSESGGSQIPPNTDVIRLYYTIPMFLKKDIIKTGLGIDKLRYTELRRIGEGSYAEVYRYMDDYYNIPFVVKRAKKNLKQNELDRFALEFKQMKTLNSPYILQVYCYDQDKNEYIMECMDCSLDRYFEKYNNTITFMQRKLIANQIFKAFEYLHSKNILHRDISPKNILVKNYDDVILIKVADFGLIKIPDSNLTNIHTEHKGYFNDPGLITEGFSSYNVTHETYALTRLLYFVMTGKTNISEINHPQLKKFVEKGLSTNKDNRFQSVNEMILCFKEIVE